MNLLDGAIIDDQALWVVCALFYLVDNCQRLGGRQLILTERLNGLWTPVFPIHRYRIAGRAITFLNPLVPWLAAVQIDWLKQDAFATAHLRRSKKLLDCYRRRLTPFRILAALLFTLFFIVGPFATHFFGLGPVLISIAPIYLVALIFLVDRLVAERRFQRMDRSELNSLLFQCALCPGIFINICRRISLGYMRVPSDVLACALAARGTESVAGIKRRLDACLDDLSEHEELTPTDAVSVQVYRRKLNAAAEYE